MKKKENISAEEFRKAMLIKTYRIYLIGSYPNEREYKYPECPRYGTPTDRDYQKFCSNCGQKLKWDFSKMKPHK